MFRSVPRTQPALPLLQLEGLCDDLSSMFPHDFTVYSDRIVVEIHITDPNDRAFHATIDMSKGYWSQEPDRDYDGWLSVLSEMYEGEEYEITDLY